MNIPDVITRIFQRPLKLFFDPINEALAMVPPVWWKVCAVGLFVGAMLWVFSLKKEYVNVDAPSNHWWYDLRLWTILSMLPHVCIYLYF